MSNLTTNQEEMITQVDESDRVIGLLPKSRFNNGKLIHRSSYLIVLNPKKGFLLQQRSLTRKWHPGRWTFPVAGTVANETYEECMRREIKEAFGENISFKYLLKYHHFDNVDKAFKTVFISLINDDEISIDMNKKYADSYAWISVEKLKGELKNKSEKFAPPFIIGMNLIFERDLLRGLL